MSLKRYIQSFLLSLIHPLQKRLNTAVSRLETSKAHDKDVPDSAPYEKSNIQATAPLDDASKTKHGPSNTQESSSSQLVFLGTPRMDLEEFTQQLFKSQDPIGTLKQFVKATKRREHLIGKGETAPSQLERFLAQLLEGAGLGIVDIELPSISVIKPQTSGLFYLRINDGSLTYMAKLFIIKVEAALNAVLFAHNYYNNPDEQSLEELFSLQRRIRQSICAQAIKHTDDEDATGEWGARKNFARALECLRLPYRLQASFRTHVKAGELACELSLVPSDVFPSAELVDGVGIVPTTVDMRAHMATEYAMRLSLLVARTAFEASPAIKRVWLAATQDTGVAHSCLISVCFEREQLESVEWDAPIDPKQLLTNFNARFELVDGELQAIEQGFSIEDERFCPQLRYEAPEQSNRVLNAAYAQALGTCYVHDLGIDESSRRRTLSQTIMREFSSSTEQNVKMILGLAEQEHDDAIREAATRTVSKLVSGTLDEDALTVADEFVDGGGLSATLAQAQTLFSDKKIDETKTLLYKALEPYEQNGVYQDTDQVEYRVFSSYIDRVLYNRLLCNPDKTMRLVDHSYIEAIMLLSICHLMLGETEQALYWAKRTAQMAPIGSASRFHLVQCLDACGYTEQAREELNILLSYAYNTQIISAAYWRLSFSYWQSGDFAVAQAVYQRAIDLVPNAFSVSPGDIQQLFMAVGGIDPHALDAQEVAKILEEAHIVDAPTKEIKDIMIEAAKASLDAEIFPVAKSFIGILGLMARDDIIFSMLKSIEDEPDR